MLVIAEHFAGSFHRDKNVIRIPVNVPAGAGTHRTQYPGKETGQRQRIHIQISLQCRIVQQEKQHRVFDTAALADELPFRLRIATVSVEHKGEIQRFPIGRITVAIPVRQHRTRRSTHVMDVVQQRFNSGRKQLFPGETVKQPGGMHLPIQPE